MADLFRVQNMEKFFQIYINTQLLLIYRKKISLKIYKPFSLLSIESKLLSSSVRGGLVTSIDSDDCTKFSSSIIIVFLNKSYEIIIYKNNYL